MMFNRSFMLLSVTFQSILPFSFRRGRAVRTKTAKSDNFVYSRSKTRAISTYVFAVSILTILSFFAFSTPAHAKGNPRYASIVMDADTGLILHQRYANKSLHPASLTKVMTLLMAFEALESGRLGLKDRIRISNHAASMVPSKLGLAEGSSIRVKDAIYALVTKSANDVAVALAEHLGGTERNFARLMTTKARNLGMSRTTFRNASGLHHSKQVSTARDMAKMGRYVINVYPEYYRYFSRKTFTYQGKTYRNHNRLMDKYSGMDGMKTGYIAASGFNLIASAVRDNRRIIGVVFGGRSSKTRNNHMARLLDRGFNKMRNIRVAKAQVPLPERKPAIAHAVAALAAKAPASGEPQRTANLSPTLQKGFERLIGEGDFDPAISRRIETGLLAIAAHKGGTSSQRAKIVSASYQPASVNRKAPWSVQIGAFKSRAATDKAIQQTLRVLPKRYAKGQPMIAPLRTANGWLFRGRLSGYSKEEALSACNHLHDCLPVAPQN